MTRSRRGRFAFWFVLLLAFFALANLATALRPAKLKPFRAIGYPQPYLVRDSGAWQFDAALALADLIAAVVLSALAAALLARTRKPAADARDIPS